MMVNGQLIGIESKTNLLLVGYLRNQPAEPYERGQMKYKIEITFDCSKELTDKEMSELESNLVLQVAEPTDFDSNDCDWGSSNINTYLEVL